MIGVDFDNTIVNYDRLFHRVALEHGLIADTLPANKEAVRDCLRAAGREAAWTEMQGCVYGARMDEADPFPGALDFFRQCRRHNLPVCVISHKTRTPYAGPAYDLHQAARDWLRRRGFWDADTGLSEQNVLFESTRADKIRRIADMRCATFIDDLPELLAAPDFPRIGRRIWFAPVSAMPAPAGCDKARDWRECGLLCLNSA